MAKTSLGIGSKLAALVISTLLLSGCYKIEIKETLNLDGTSSIATEVDMSGMADAMSSITESLSVNIEGAGPLTEVPMEAVAPTYTSCSDPLLLAKHGADKLEGPEIILSTLQIKKSTSCALSKTEGYIDIIIEEADTASGDTVSTQILERKADSCKSPAILAFYQIASFEDPITEEYTLEKTVEVSCSDSRKEVVISTITSFAGSDESEALTERFEKPAPVVIPDNTLAELDALMLNPEDATNAEEAPVEAIEVCSKIDEDPEELPFFFTSCENTAPGVGVFNYKKYDTTGLKINANGTVTYSLNSTTQSFNDKIENDNSSSDMEGATPAMIGITAEYVFISPWPILEHNAGELEDAYTLRLDLFKLNDAKSVTVTLDTDGSTLDLVSPRTQLQIDNLITTLKERLTTSTAPVERQVEYIYLLSNKIQRLAALKPSQQVALGYLQTKLINLAEDLQIDPLAELEADFLSEIENLDAEVFTEDEEESFEGEEGEEEDLETIETDVETKTKLEVETEAEVATPKEEAAPETPEKAEDEPDDSQDNDDEDEEDEFIDSGIITE